MDVQRQIAKALRQDPQRAVLEYRGEMIDCGRICELADSLIAGLQEAGVPQDAPVAVVARNRPARASAGLGLIDETVTLLELWAPGMSASELFQVALDSGQFPNVSARRLRNIVAECFRPRYMAPESDVVAHLKQLHRALTGAAFWPIAPYSPLSRQRDPGGFCPRGLLGALRRRIRSDQQGRRH